MSEKCKKYTSMTLLTRCFSHQMVHPLSHDGQQPSEFCQHYPKMNYVYCHIDQWLLRWRIHHQHNLTDGTWEICQKVPRNKFILMNHLEKTIMTCGAVLHTSKDKGLEDIKTNTVKDALHTLAVPQNSYKAVLLEEEPQPIRESHTSLNWFPPKMCCE